MIKLHEYFSLRVGVRLPETLFEEGQVLPVNVLLHCAKN